MAVLGNPWRNNSASDSNCINKRIAATKEFWNLLLCENLKASWIFWLHTRCHQWTLMQNNWDNLTKKNKLKSKRIQYRIILQVRGGNGNKDILWIISILYYSQITACQIEDASLETPERFNKSIYTHWFISAFLSATTLIIKEKQ